MPTDTHLQGSVLLQRADDALGRELLRVIDQCTYQNNRQNNQSVHHCLVEETNRRCRKQHQHKHRAKWLDEPPPQWFVYNADDIRAVVLQPLSHSSIIEATDARR